MQTYEYRVLPAPRRGVRAKGVRRAEDRFALAVEAEMNRMASEGWEFVRSDTLPSERRSGWFSRPATVFETLLVFRRDLSTAPRAQTAMMPPPVSLGTHAHTEAFAPLGAPETRDTLAPHPPAPSVQAPAASRFTPPPGPPLPANTAAPVAMPPAPSLTLVRDTPPLPADPESPDSRRAAD